MQFKFDFNVKSPLTLPLSYHDIVQAMIYDMISINHDYSKSLHDTGYQSEGHGYKLFVFSLLDGKKEINPPDITFHDHVSFELRSPMQEFCDVVTHAIACKDHYRLGEKILSFESVSISRKTIDTESVNIKMLSPVCLHTTYSEGEKRKTKYYNPLDAEFTDLLNSNLNHKFQAAHEGKSPEGCISISPEALSPKDKYVTKFGDTYITAWNGTYNLQGPSELLTFLYDTGLGDRNSQGFGMFEV